MNSRYVVSVLTLFLFSLSNAFAQKDLSFGKVSLKELKMTSFERDSTAGAIILCDIGKFDGNSFLFSRHLRIKILKKSGLNFGNWTFNTSSKSDFNISVFNLAGNEVVREKATSNSIYREEIVDGFNVYKVFAPGVRVGSVIDIEYTFVGLPFEWRFQEMIPVVYSSLTLEPTRYTEFTKSSMGFEPIEKVSDFQWKAENMPAFKVENFLSNYANYITKFNIQVTSIHVPGGLFRDIPEGLHREYSTEWRRVVDYLLNHSRFGQIKNNSGFLNDFARDLKDKNIPVLEKATEAYYYIQKNIKWSGAKSVYLSKEFRKNFQVDHVGNSADVNLMLYALLDKAGVSAYPVVLSTRDNGVLIPFSPSLDKLNYVVVMVEDGNSRIMLDATSVDIVPGILPPYCLNGNGLLMKRDNEQWIDLNRKNIFTKKQFAAFTISSEGTARAKVTQDFSGYAFVDWAEAFRRNNSDHEIQKNMLQKQFPDAKITSYEISQNDRTNTRSKESIEFDISDQIINTGSELIFNPLMFLDYTQNPFKSEERKYPIDFTYPKEYNSTIVVSMPEGYSLSKAPESVKFANPDGSVTFTFLAKENGNSIQLKVMLKFSKHIFSETEYADLRTLYSEISRVVTTPIEITKKSLK